MGSNDRWTGEEIPTGRGFRARYVAMISIAVGCLVLLGACGGGSDSKPTPTPTTVATIAAPTTAATTDASGASASEDTGDPEATLAAAETQSAGLEPTYSAMATNISAIKFSVEACTLVSRSDMEKILGTSLTADPTSASQSVACEYDTASTTITLTAATKDDLKAVIKASGQDTDIDNFYKDQKNQAKSADGYKEIDGVGDDAYYTTDGGLVSYKGDKFVQVDGGTVDQDTEIAKKAYDNW